MKIKKPQYRIKQIGDFYYPQEKVFLSWYIGLVNARIYESAPVRCDSLKEAKEYIEEHKKALEREKNKVRKVHWV